MLMTMLTACAGLGVGENKVTESEGVYRLPYGDGVRVRISRDHRTHHPPNRLDLVGVGATSYRIVAAARGIVRYIVDEFDVRQDSGTTRYCNNNYVWLEHPNGEWTKYSHVRQHSAQRRASLHVGDVVEAGTYLGDEGDVGCATRSHLHFEVAVPYDRTHPITYTGGFIKGRNLVPRFCGVPEEVLLAGATYVATKCGNGAR
jgi:murein DD-endopeptidase MepM/ murein hydrolase activator NlpD